MVVGLKEEEQLPRLSHQAIKDWSEAKGGSPSSNIIALGVYLPLLMGLVEPRPGPPAPVPPSPGGRAGSVRRRVSQSAGWDEILEEGEGGGCLVGLQHPVQGV